jgi:hypothetical protein
MFVGYHMMLKNAVVRWHKFHCNLKLNGFNQLDDFKELYILLFLSNQGRVHS